MTRKHTRSFLAIALALLDTVIRRGRSASGGRSQIAGAGTRTGYSQSAAEMLRFHYTAEHKPENVDLAETNSGLFWQTRFDVTYVGHNGSDPGIRTAMLASLAKDTGVLLFTNASGDGSDRAFVAMIRALFAHADALRQAAAALRD